MDMAKPMVTLAKNISTKIRDKQGEISEVRVLLELKTFFKYITLYIYLHI